MPAGCYSQKRIYIYNKARLLDRLLAPHVGRQNWFVCVSSGTHNPRRARMRSGSDRIGESAVRRIAAPRLSFVGSISTKGFDSTRCSGVGRISRYNSSWFSAVCRDGCSENEER